MPVQSLPRSAEVYAASQRVEIGAALAATRRLWSRMGENFDASYVQIAPQLLLVVQQAQRDIAPAALDYVPAVLEETGQAAAARPVAQVSVSPLVGYAGDGRPIDTLLYEAVVGAKVAVAQGTAPREALSRAESWLSTAVGTVLSDTARHGESLAMGVRPVGGYVRMLNPPSCSRCVVLAGRWYRKSAGFARHP